MRTVQELRDDYDWQQVFAYGGKPMVPDSSGDTPSNYSHATTIGCCEGAKCKPEPFDFNDVAEVIAAVDGQNDEANWIAVVKLSDGRLAFLDAGCDYTGWDCQSGGSACVSHSLSNLARFGLTNDARTRMLASEHTAPILKQAIKRVAKVAA